MKRPLQLPLAIALALGGTNALALGLGPVQVKSKLNQPLDAEIPVIQGSAGEAEGLLVNLATAEDFERIGISRSRLNVPLEFSVVQGKNGPVIKVTSQDPVRDAYLDFLIEANWPKGRLLREYTVLLDPPVTAPARRTAAAPASSAASSASTQPLRESRPAPTPKAPVAAAPARPVAKPAPAPAAAPATPARIADGEYGPVEAGETLSAIARAARPDAGVNVNQMMLALLKANPDAFYKDNVNALKRGAILRIPSESEIAATGSAREAAAEIQGQIEDWRGGRASPTRIADAGARAVEPRAVAGTPAPSRESARSVDDERLELVPPKAGDGNLAMADQPGSGASGAAVSNALKAELARTKEALATRDQETGELKSRVRELEDIGSKNDRLISLKDSEIADLQRRLRELQEKEKSAAAATVAPAATATPAPAPEVAAPVAATAEPESPTTTVTATPSADEQAQLDKKDIWGDTAAEPATPSSEVASVTEPPASPAEPTTPDATPAASGETTASPAAAEQPPTPSGAAEVTPLATTPPAAQTAPAPAPTRPVTPTPAPAAAPWYDAPWVKPAAIGAGVLLLAGGLLGLRRRKPVPAARGSIADSFGESPLGAGGGGAMAAEADSLREQLRDDPANLGLHLELLSVFYAERDVAAFEEAAADMHVQVADPNAPEWLEAQAMGQELAPHNPLFAYESDYVADHAVTEELPAHDPYAPIADYEGPPPARDEYAFGDLEPAEDVFDVQAPPPAATSAADTFTFEDLPPLEVPMDEKIEATPMVPDEVPVDDGFFTGEDAIGTKLDLAKAYMDMGDPDGARSMLDEVVAEGNEAQRAEAQRLMGELR